MVVVQAGVSGTRAALAGRRGGEAVLERAAASDQPDPHAAAVEAIERLAAGGPLPRGVLLLTAQAVAGVIALPVAPGQPRPAAQMQEMVRWELEPLLAEHVAAHPIGSIMVGRGVMSPWQVAEVAGQVGRPSAGASPGGPGAPTARSVQRFGEIAVAMGYITRQTLDACLGLQEWIQLGQDQYVCGWRPIGDQPTAEGAYRWLGCAISREARAKWRAVFEGAGHELVAIQSPFGASAACRFANGGDADRPIVELEPDHQACAQTTGGAITGLRVGYDVETTGLAERIVEWTGGVPSAGVLVCGGHGGLAGAAAELAERLGAPVEVGRPVGWPAEGPDGEADAGTRDSAGAGEAEGGAAYARMLGGWTDVGRGRPLLPTVRPTDPGPALYRRPIAWWAAAAALLIAAPLALELFHRGRIGAAERRLAEVQSQRQRIERAVDELKTRNQRIDALGERLEALRDRHSSARREVAMLDEGLQRRQRRPGALLESFARSAPSGLVVDAPRSVSAMRLAVSQLIEQCGATLASFEPIGSAEARAPGGGAPAGSLDAADREEGRDNRGDGAGGQAGGVMAEQASDDDAGLSGAGSLTEWLAGRPKQQLIVECDYDQLCRLTRGLGRLSWRVVVTDFEVETVTDQPGRPLRARLVLAY